MDKKYLETLVKLGYNQAERVILQAKKPLCPTWVMIDADKNIYLMATPWKDEIEKMIYEQIIRISLREKKAVAYSVVTEAWMSSYKDGREYKGVQPRHDPNRIETVVIFATDGTQRIMKNWLLKRDHLEQPLKLEEMKPAEEGQAESWMFTLLAKDE